MRSALLLLVLLFGAPVRAYSQLPPLPKTGLDFSAVDQFWRITDMLRSGQIPTEADWTALLSSTGYRLAIGNVPSVRNDITVTFSPSRRAEFDSVTAQQTDRAYRLKHLARAVPRRDALDSLRASLVRSAPIADGVRGSARFLPAGATDSGDPPLVAVAIFTYDGYAGNAGVIVDLLYILENGIVPLLSHEFHHVYGARYDLINRPPVGSPDFPLVAALSALRVEGIADLIDKPYPLESRSAAMSPYITRYRDVYERTPEILRTVDSLLVVIGRDSTVTRSAGQRVRNLLWSNSHPNGAYMARSIHEAFGADSLDAGLANPFAFIRIFTASESRRGRATPFSPAGMIVLDALERKYLKRTEGTP